MSGYLGWGSGAFGAGSEGSPLVLHEAWASAPGPLGAAAVHVYYDSAAAQQNIRSVYVMDLITPGGLVRVPISSWQATLQTSTSNYTQCVVPACHEWADTLNAATEFVILRRAVLPAGTAIEYEMVRAPTDTLQFDRGPQRYTCTLSGYTTAFLAVADPNPAFDRTLTGVRSISSGSAMRVRCAVDWQLRPGQRAWVEGTAFVVKFINYYSPSGFDSYMDVGG